METAKIDVRKLQLLNERINQTLEALNQVRLSVHGLQYVPDVHTPFFGYNPGVPGIGLGYGYGYSANVPGNVFGIPGVSPFTTPWGLQNLNTLNAVPQPFWANPWGARPYGVNGHEAEGAQARYNEAVRFSQTPFAFSPMPIPAVG